jgi:predicted helicase
VRVTIYGVLDDLRESALDKRHKGDLFERLIKAFLTTDPEWQQRFSDVEAWTDWEHREGVRDIGIDLVAKNRYDDGWSAIQCKFYDQGETVAKGDIDKFIATSYRKFDQQEFTHRFIFDTADKWSGNAEEVLKGQVQRIDIGDLDDPGYDWSQWSVKAPEKVVYTGPKKIRPHQTRALEDVTTGFKTHDRGKLIMACGTGKTFTSLKIAEEQAGKGGTVLFLVPSIQLLSQSLREWMAQTSVGIRPFAVCSDVRVGRRDQNNDLGDQSTVDLSEPPTTNAAKLVERFEASPDPNAMTVVFSTYQSIDVVIDAQKAGLPEFDLVICDEAHRTTGVTLAGDENSDFVKVHDDNLLHAKKRLYMTATPRMFDDSVKRKADEKEAVLWDMNDEALFGPEFHRLGFGKAVEDDLLTDYKVLVLAVDEQYIARQFQRQWDENEIPLDDIAKLVGCWNGLDKHFKEQDDAIKDWRPMRTAVAFSQTINASKTATNVFPQISERINDTLIDGDPRRPLAVESKHVDGTMGIHERNSKLAWLKAPPEDETCRILTNARCLSEGVDVPALDAVLFLTPRGSQVDVVQSVGRVMRKAEYADGSKKELGYIILPVVIPSEVAPEEALQDNVRYKVVWQVLQALRSHDDRFHAEINKINLNKKKSPRIRVISVTAPYDDDEDRNRDRNGGNDDDGQLTLAFPEDEVIDAMYARIVQKVGEREYWATWASRVAEIAEKHIVRIQGLLHDPDSKASKEFKRFLKGLRGNLNESITDEEAIEMLAQHLITRPIFDKLFEGYDFTASNPVARVMERMLKVLDEKNLDDENQTLRDFYDRVGRNVDGVDNAEGKQKILIELYDHFFKAAFKRSQEKLGIVYTPTEVADFILRSADAVLKQEFGQALTDENVHILDGFTGTGTFLVRLLQSGLIKPEDLPRKYAQELHAGEILLLAYYIASVNIENTYHDLTGDTKAFEGLVLTDTFQSWEPDDRLDLDVFQDNNARLEALKKLKITVIVGNPPYSSGQDDANDNNANEYYPSLDDELRKTYTARSSSSSRFKQYDSYIRAIKWATLRIQDRGVIAYVSNGGWIDSNTADGMRKSLADEFSAIYIWNLRGNQRTAGEQSRKEGGKVFGGGSRATVAITLLVKNPDQTGPATIYYIEVDDYLTREQKLAQVAGANSMLDLPGRPITPNQHGDWINQRREDFDKFLPIDGATGVFAVNTMGVVSNRDAWVYGSSSDQVVRNLVIATNTYDGDLARDKRTLDSKAISWSAALEGNFKRRTPAPTVRADRIRTAAYRPFFRQHLYFERFWNQQVSKTVYESFPSESLPNVGIYQVGAGSAVPFSVLAANSLWDLHLTGAGSGGQFFPRYRYEPAERDGSLFVAAGEVIDGYRKIDNITVDALTQFQSAYPDEQITKDDVFFYVYGLLHSPEYRDAYAADLKKMLPRIPFARDFRAFADAGHALSDLHLKYESADRYPLGGLDVEPLTGIDPYEFFAVEKTKFAGSGKNKDKSTLVYNGHITLSSIPEDAHRYMLGSRSAIEWLIDRYQVKIDKASQIKNDPNEWSRELEDPRYIIDLFARITTVSIETMKIVDALPALEIIEVKK